MKMVEGVVAQVQGLSSSRDDWVTLPPILEAQQDTWDAPQVDYALSQLDPGVHTVGYAQFL